MKRLMLSVPAFLTISVLFTGCTSTNPRVTTKLNEDAVLIGNLPRNPLKDSIITSWVDGSDKQHRLMSTLYGNDIAAHFARTGGGYNYPAGSVLSVVTWTQQEDGRWFGGNIPFAPQSVEILTVAQTDAHATSYQYQKFEGKPLQQVAVQTDAKPSERAAFLLNQRAAVMP